jgi:hypothetical protein
MDNTEPATEDLVTIKNEPVTVKADISKEDGTVPAATDKINADSGKNTNLRETEEEDGTILTSFLNKINWMPPWCRYDPNKPPKFTLSMNILLAFVCSTSLLLKSRYKKTGFRTTLTTA